MRLETLLIATGAFATAAFLTHRVRKMALARGVLDRPNSRSSHQVPMPRGGGLAIVIAATAGFLALQLMDMLSLSLFLAFTGGIAVAAVGFVDDHKPLSASVRLAVHFCAALFALICLDGLPSLRIGHRVVTFGWEGYLLGAFGIVWLINLFNFMDGIDGIAASEAAFVSWGGSLLMLTIGLSGTSHAAGLVFGAACCGFLIWNWPPAKIFMGDVGSGYLGYIVAVLAIASANPSGLLIWLILGGVFFVDATITLVRRLARGEQVYEGHRSHAYQWLARRWQSHKRVTLVVIAVNFMWLFPAAWLASLYPDHALWIAAVVLMPLIVLALLAGAGRSERPVVDRPKVAAKE